MTSAEAAEHWSNWERALGDAGLVSYRHIGCSSRATSPHTAEGGFRLRRDLRVGGGMRVAPLGIAMLDTAGINVDALAVVAPTQIDVTVIDPARDVEQIGIRGRVVREGRTQMVTEARFHDASRPERLVAFGTASWAVVGPCPPGYRYIDPGRGAPDEPGLPSLEAAFGAEPHPGGGFAIAALSARVGATSLHQGPIQVVLEAAAIEAAAVAVPADVLTPDHSTVSIVQRGSAGPFVATAEVLATSGEAVACRAELRDDGAGGRVVAIGLSRYRRD